MLEKPCECNGGYCSCKDGVGGERCDQCLNGYYNFSIDGCTGDNINFVFLYIIMCILPLLLVFMLQLVNVMSITPSVCCVMMVSAHVHWVSPGHNVTSARMAGTTLPAVAVSHVTVTD